MADNITDVLRDYSSRLWVVQTTEEAGHMFSCPTTTFGHRIDDDDGVVSVLFWLDIQNYINIYFPRYQEEKLKTLSFWCYKYQQ